MIIGDIYLFTVRSFGIIGGGALLFAASSLGGLGQLGEIGPLLNQKKYIYNNNNMHIKLHSSSTGGRSSCHCWSGGHSCHVHRSHLLSGNKWLRPVLYGHSINQRAQVPQDLLAGPGHIWLARLHMELCCL